MHADVRWKFSLKELGEGHLYLACLFKGLSAEPRSRAAVTLPLSYAARS